jgi:tryptophan-rich sensory protein
MVFFASQNALAGFFNIIVLWLSIILCMVIVRKISKASFYLLIPYLLWVSFAAVLNFFSIK